MFETLLQDVRHGVRMLIREPAFAFVSIVSIAVGVAVCATIFSVADGFLMRPLPVPRASEILTINGTTPADRGNGTPLSYPDFVDLRDRRAQLQRRLGPPAPDHELRAPARRPADQPPRVRRQRQLLRRDGDPSTSRALLRRRGGSRAGP